MSKVVKIILILVIFGVIFFTVFNIYVRSLVKQQKDQIIQREKSIAEKELAKSGESSASPLLHIPQFDTWQIHNYPDAGFAARFPSIPQVHIKQEPQYFDQESSFAANTDVPGEKINYIVYSYKDKNMTLYSLINLYGILYGNGIEFSDITTGKLYGNKVATYTATYPKKAFGKMTVIGDQAYLIHAECLYCTEVPEFDNFVNSFQLINN